MRVLILYPYGNHDRMVEQMVKHLRLNGVDADAFNYMQLRFNKASDNKYSHLWEVIGSISPYFTSYLRKLVIFTGGYKRIILKLSKKYDIIDFHVFGRSVDSPIMKLIDKKVVKITIWGSDFYRADEVRRQQQRMIYEKCASIQVSTSKIKIDFLNYYNSFEEKIRVANFGIKLFDDIMKIEKGGFSNRFKIGNNREKTMIVCGYNGSRAQQHLKIIEAFQLIRKELRQSIFIIVPMTYGADDEYINLVNKELDKTSINYQILQTHLSIQEVAHLRIEADLVINMQITDAFSGSLQEHIFAGNLLLVGSWLPYSIFDEHEIFYKISNLEDLTNNIEDCLDNLDNYKGPIQDNKEKIYNLSSWEVAGKRMSKIYKELVNEPS